MANKLLLPLKYYDNAGRIIPPISLWATIFYVSKALFVLIASLTFVQDKSALLGLFYPVKSNLYVGLVISLAGLLVFIICGFREKIWKNKKNYLFGLIKPVLILVLIVDFIFQLYMANQHQWAFSWTLGVSAMLDLLILYWVVTSKHLAFMLLDWKFELDSKAH